MSYVAVVAGPARSGKSSLIAAAIVHAHRLTARGARPAGRSDNSHHVHRPAPLEYTGRALAVEVTGADAWNVSEVRRIATAPDVDALSRDLWHDWLGAGPPAEPIGDAPAALPFAVTSVAADLVGHDKGPTVTLVEVAADLFEGLARPGETRSRSRALAEHRLLSVLDRADAVVLCLPGTSDWSAAATFAVHRVVSRLRTLLHSTDFVLALTKSDLALAARALERHASTDPVDPFPPDLADDMLGASCERREFWHRLRRTANIRLQLCSSYGLLCRSGTPNVDLAPLQLMGGIDPDHPLRPLWPQPSLRISDLVPSAVEALDDWLPLGVVDAVFGATPQTHQ